jgi:7,8-dihydropterin-6-yl-methyl-4-(beta-D-ribofuranosyl)aminobenzene 5'-phosphate synthase
MGIKIEEVDVAVLSHGHYDHGGGMSFFLERNHQARVYVHEDAFGDFISERFGGETAEIGLRKAIMQSGRLVFTRAVTMIEEDMILFSDVPEVFGHPSSNRNLFVRESGEVRPDLFAHEQNLLFRSDRRSVLFMGCAHRGVRNILVRAREILGQYPDVVIGGFHLYSPGAGRGESPEVVDELGRQLLATGSLFYTCHCTGADATARLRQIMGDRLRTLSAGERIDIHFKGEDI